ncbi:hypothetical protein J6590_084395 [Homalodisca vitripennis]|nr:hypothetical protein J6590_084395 [Homalodisca vitripennis]
MEQVLTVPFPYLVLDRRVATCPDIEQITLIFSVHIRIVVLVVSRVTTKQVMACDKGNNPQLENQASFISIIKEYPVILEKSNIPSIKNKRNRTIEEIQNRIDNELGLHLDSSQILKKFNNMKSRVKSKADTNKTGNKKVILKPWEEELLNFIEGDTDNPAIVRLKGTVLLLWGLNRLRMKTVFLLTLRWIPPTLKLARTTQLRIDKEKHKIQLLNNVK